MFFCKSIKIVPIFHQISKKHKIVLGEMKKVENSCPKRLFHRNAFALTCFHSLQSVLQM